MEYTPGMILEGTVKSIAGFGAFVQLPDGRTGLVHISEVASTYVNDIRQHLTEGQAVRVKILNVESGKLSLSVKQAQPKPEQAPKQPRVPRPDCFVQPARPEPDSFEEKLKQFMADSNSKISGVRQYEHRTRSRKR